MFHRGLTHSLIGLVALPPLLAAGLWWGLGRRTGFGWLCLLCWAGAALHILYDVLTPWGTMLLYPFSLERSALDWIFILDPVTWLLPLAAILVAWRRRARSRTAAVAFLAAMVVYSALAGVAHGAVRRATARAERAAGRPVDEAYAYPQFGGPWRWQGIAVAPESIPEPRISRYTIEGLPPVPGTPDRLTRGFDDPWARRALASPRGQEYLWWAGVPMATVEESADSVLVTLSDLRYRRTIMPAAETWVPFALRFTFEPSTGALRSVRW